MYYVTAAPGFLVTLGLLYIAAGMLRWLYGEYRSWRDYRRRDLSEILASRVVRSGDLQGMLTDAVLAQDMRWLQDQAAGRPSVI